MIFGDVSGCCFANTWSKSKTERDGASRGREFCQQTKTCDLMCLFAKEDPDVDSFEDITIE